MLSQGNVKMKPKAPLSNAAFYLNPYVSDPSVSPPCFLLMNKLKPLPVVYMNNTCKNHTLTYCLREGQGTKCHTDRRCRRNNDIVDSRLK